MGTQQRTVLDGIAQSRWCGLRVGIVCLVFRLVIGLDRLAISRSRGIALLLDDDGSDEDPPEADGPVSKKLRPDGGSSMGEAILLGVPKAWIDCSTPVIMAGTGTAFA